MTTDGPSAKREQERKPTIRLPSRALDLHGKQVGDLTVLRPVGRGDDRGIIWECECVCGRTAYRSASALSYAMKTGAVPCCQQCLEELRSGWGEWKRRLAAEGQSQRNKFYRQLWDNEKTLYSQQEIDRLEREIAELMWRETLVVPDDPDELWLRRRIEQVGSIGTMPGWTPGQRPVAGDPLPEEDMPGTEQGAVKPYAPRHIDLREPDPLEHAGERHQAWLEQKQREHDEPAATTRRPRRGSLSPGWFREMFQETFGFWREGNHVAESENDE